jgi:hypothetical protein
MPEVHIPVSVLKAKRSEIQGRMEHLRTLGLEAQECVPQVKVLDELIQTWGSDLDKRGKEKD